MCVCAHTHINVYVWYVVCVCTCMYLCLCMCVCVLVCVFACVSICVRRQKCNANPHSRHRRRFGSLSTGPIPAVTSLANQDWGRQSGAWSSSPFSNFGNRLLILGTKYQHCKFYTSYSVWSYFLSLSGWIRIFSLIQWKMKYELHPESTYFLRKLH